jgi:hypothetical protein
MGTTDTPPPAGPVTTAEHPGDDSAEHPGEHPGDDPGSSTGDDRTGHHRPAAWRRRRWVVDTGVVLAFLAAALWLMQGLWPDPASRAMALNPEDQILIEWFLAVDTRVLLGDHGLVSDRLNVPDGMNMLVNATALTLGVLLAPVTLTLGAPVSFAVIMTGNVAATAAAFYLLFARTLGLHRGAAAVGGAFCGFAPAMVSQSNSHWHMTALWLLPPIIWSVVRMVRAAEARDSRRILTSGLWLAALVVVQLFLGEEVLYLAALTLALLTIAYAAMRREWARRIAPGFLAGMAVATGAATLVLTYPLWVQFAGPGSVPNGPFPPGFYSADLLSWPAFSPLSIAGSEQAARLATGAAEYNTFLGWPLLLVAVGLAAWLWRHPIVRAATVAALVMGLLSLGPELVVNQERTGVPMLYSLLTWAPVIDGALPQRYAMAWVPLLAFLLALALDRARSLPGRARFAVPAVVAVALLPLVPTPLPTEERAPVPEFISGGHWRDCVEPGGGVLVPVPLPTPPQPEPMRWAAAADAEFALPEGFFIGPYGREGRASMGIFPRPTSALLAAVATTGEVPAIGAAERAQASADLDHWGAQCVVLGPDQRYEAELLTTLAELLGRPGERVADAWIWRV